MEGSRPRLLAGMLILLTMWILLLGMYGLLKPISNGCAMTFMYPKYIPVLTSLDSAHSKYGLYLYYEGWKQIDYGDHLRRLSGVPVLFVPGNGGSYQQVRSLGAESERAFQRGVMERSYYQEGILKIDEGYNPNVAGFQLPSRYSSRLDWFCVDLEGEHSAMDGRILEDHTDYVVYAIHRILDHYKLSHESLVKEGASVFSSLPKSIILVGHSMGGFVARAVVVHPRLRKGAVETVVTLSTPHQLPPVPLQPSMGQYYLRVNEEWRKGYKVQTSPTGHYQFDPLLSNVVVVSLSGGFNDYQVRTNFESLNDIVPPTHGFMISSTSITNVWLSMEHQVSHSLLSLVDPKTNQPISDARKRLAVFAKMLRSGIPQSFPWIHQSCSSHMPADYSSTDVKDSLGPSLDTPSCPSNIRWNSNELERDLYIESTMIAVLAMDGRRRWMDIHKLVDAGYLHKLVIKYETEDRYSPSALVLGSNGKSHFILVTNISPCSGIQIHLWREKNESKEGLAARESVVEVTRKLVQIPSGPPPRQNEPGTQTEQVAPSAVLWLSPKDMRGFRFLTISVVHRLTVSGRPPAASMAVGQFFNPDDGSLNFSFQSIIMSSYSHKKGVSLREEHPLAFNLSFSITLGLLPISLSLKTVGCGIEKAKASENKDDSQLCKLLCFPPLALAWDTTAGLHVFPNLSSGTIVVDSTAIKASFQGSEKTSVLLLVDPHCSYEMSVSVSFSSTASRFFLLHGFQILGLAVVVIFFALMRQSYEWNIDGSTPSMLRAIESNLRLTLPSLLLGVGPIVTSLIVAFLMSQTVPSFGIFAVVYFVCYAIANGLVLLLSLFSQSVFYAAALTHVTIKSRWQNTETHYHFFTKLSSRFFTLKVIRIFTVQPILVTSLTAISLACFVDTAIGLSVLFFYHVLSCHYLLCSYVREKKLFYSNKEIMKTKILAKHEDGNGISSDNHNPNSPKSGKTFGESQLDIFYHRHGFLVLHLLATLMFSPSLVAWLQRIRSGHSIPRFLDSILCIGIIFHGTLAPRPEFNALFNFRGKKKVRIEFLYLAAGVYSYFSALDSKPYKVFYPMAIIGFLLLASRIARIESGESHFERRKHSHRH